MRASSQDLAAGLVFSVVPITAVKALAGSPLGARLHRRLEARKASAAAKADAVCAAAHQACTPASVWWSSAAVAWSHPVRLPGASGRRVPGRLRFRCSRSRQGFRCFRKLL